MGCVLVLHGQVTDTYAVRGRGRVNGSVRVGVGFGLRI